MFKNFIESSDSIKTIFDQNYFDQSSLSRISFKVCFKRENVIVDLSFAKVKTMGTGMFTNHLLSNLIYKNMIMLLNDAFNIKILKKIPNSAHDKIFLIDFFLEVSVLINDTLNSFLVFT